LSTTMGIVRLPFVLERFDVICYEQGLGVKLGQVSGFGFRGKCALMTKIYCCSLILVRWFC